MQEKDDLIALDEESSWAYQTEKKLKVATKKVTVVAKKTAKFLGETGSGLADTFMPKYFKDRRNLKDFNKLQDRKHKTQDQLQVSFTCDHMLHFLFDFHISLFPVPNPLRCN